MNEEVQEVPPKWLKELEDKRERRLKARLGHEAGAGSPCLTCEDKCPGLDLHFWRKICKNCKCGKENHDVNDDDIYGWAQFQLLGSKPNKGKKFVLPGRKDAVELEWMPKGQNDVVESYLKDLPVNLLPIKGSAAAQERKQLLQKQIPLHDIDPALCHALTENEIKQMNDYITHVKQNSVGMGHIMKLNELLKNRQSANAQVLASRAPMQLPQFQNIVLQGVDRANSLKAGADLHRALRDLSIDEQKLYNVSQDEKLAANNVRDVLYETYLQNVQVPQSPVSNRIDYQNSVNLGTIHDVKYPSWGDNMQIPVNTINRQDDYQASPNAGIIRDLQHPQNMVQMPNKSVYNKNDNQYPVNAGEIHDVKYPSHGDNMQIPINPRNTQDNYQGSTNAGIIRDLQYPQNSARVPNQPVYNKNDYQDSVNAGTIHDINYPIQGNNMQIPVNPTSRQDNYQGSAKAGVIRDLQYPQNMAKIPNQSVYNKNDYQDSVNAGTIHDINYPIQGNNMQIPVNPTNRQDNYQGSAKAGVIRDLQYSQNMAKIPNQSVYNKNDYQNSANAGTIHDINYPIQGNNMQIPVNLPNNQGNYQGSAKAGVIRDLQYPQNMAKIPNQPVSNKIDYQNASNMGGITDIHYTHNLPNQSQNSKNLPHFANSRLANMENIQKPVDYGGVRNVYPDMNVNFEAGDLQTNLEGLDNVQHMKGDTKMPHYAPGKFNTFAEQQNPQKIGNIKDLAYSTYNPSSNLDASNQNLADPSFGSKGPRSHLPVNYNPHELNVMEQNLNPASIHVGIINDIEYPTIKAAVQQQNDILEPNVPRKNVQFDFSRDDEILPSCHKCKKMFDATALVIGIDRTESLWHAECFKCTGCNQNLADLMYFYHKESDDIYCGRDYAKIRGIPRCQACDELIFVKEYCLAENSTFHVKHFCCFECDEPLAGQNYVMEESQPLCLPCFEKIKAEKCNTCLKVIKPDEQGANLNGVHFHADDRCFACKMCQKPLLGAKLLFKNQNLYCSAPCFSADK